MNLLKADKGDFQNSKSSFVIQPWVANNKSERTFALWSQDHYVDLYNRISNCGTRRRQTRKHRGEDGA